MDLDPADQLILATIQSGGEFSSEFTLVREFDGELVTIAGKRTGGIDLNEDGPIGLATFTFITEVIREDAGTVLVADSDSLFSRVWRVGLDGFQEVLGGGPIGSPDYSYIPLADQRYDFLTSMALDSQGNLYMLDRDACTLFMARGIEQTSRPSFAVSISQPPSTTPNSRSAVPARVTVTADGAPPRGQMDIEIQPLTEGGFSSTTSGLTNFQGTLDTELWTGLAPGDYDFGVEISNIEGVAAASQISVTALTPASDSFTPVLNSFGRSGTPVLPGPASQSSLNSPQFLETAADGTVFVTDTNAKQILEISPLGQTSVLAGSGAGINSNLNGPARLASFEQVFGLARVGSSLYFTNQTRLLRIELEADPEPRVEVIAGNGGSGCGFRDSGGTLSDADSGLTSELEMSSARGIAALPNGEIVVVDGAFPFRTGCESIWQFSGGQANRVVRRRTGGCDETFFNLMGSVAVDASGDIYFGATDVSSCNGPRGVSTPAAIYKLVGQNPQVVEIIAGGGTTPTPNGILARDAEIGNIYSMAFGPDGSLYMADFAGALLYRVDNPSSADPAQRTITTFAGLGSSLETQLAVAREDLQFVAPVGITFADDGRLLVIDSKTIRALEP